MQWLSQEKLLNKSVSETLCAQLHLMTNIPIKILSHTSGANCDLTQFLDRQKDGQTDMGKSKCRAYKYGRT